MKNILYFVLMFCCCSSGVKLTLYIPHIKNDNVAFMHRHVSRDTINDCDQDGRTLLHHAAEHNAINVLSWLLNNGADNNLRDNNDESALDIAHRLKNEASAERLAVLRLYQLT